MTVEELAQQYISLQDTIHQLEAEADDVKRSMANALPPYIEGLPAVDCGEGVRAQWVKGRTAVRVDAGVAKKALILDGLPIEKVEKAFAAATTTTTGQPTIRVWREKGNG